MFWSKKEGRNTLPDLPPYRKPTLIVEQRRPEVHQEIEEEHEHAEKQVLPSFPDSLNNKGFSQAAIKGAVTSEEESIRDNENMESLNDSNDFKSVEMEEWMPSIKDNDMDRQVRVPLRNYPNYSERLKEPPNSGFEDINKMQKKNADIFVKLDKFYSARKALFDAQQKLDDVNELLKRIRETKLREEQELGGWEKELMIVKARINDLNVNLFEKVD